MAWSPTTPVTGAAQTGFTGPTYTLTADTAPDSNGKQHAVTALGGTQTGVTTHSVSSPFTATFVRPKTFKALGKPNPTTGLVVSVPRNVYTTIIRKGVTVLAGQPIQNAMVRITHDVPAGSDLADAPNLRAMLSLAYGIINQQSAGVGDTLVSGVM